MTDRTMWAVGPDDGEGWMAINARTEDEACTAWARADANLPATEPIPDWIVALRQEGWDALPEVTGADWLRVGLGYSCAECQELAFLEFGAQIIDGQPICGECVKGRGETA